MQTDAGPRYTRNGHFNRAVDGTLTTEDGAVVLGDSGPIRLGTGPLGIASDGTIRTGATIAGKDTPYDTVPWFWSDQYDVKLQMSGLSAGHDAHAIRGSLEEGRFSIFYFRADRLVGVDSVNRPAEHLLTRKLVGRSTLTAAQAADATFDLKALAG